MNQNPPPINPAQPKLLPGWVYIIIGLVLALVINYILGFGYAIVLFVMYGDSNRGDAFVMDLVGYSLMVISFLLGATFSFRLYKGKQRPQPYK